MPKKRKVTRIKKDDGTVCIRPDGFFDPCLTMCGDVDVGYDYTPTNRPVTCDTCKREFETLRHGLMLAGI